MSTLGRTYLIMILTALALGIPVALWLIDQWLANYEYAMGMDWKALLITAAAVLAVGLAAVGLQITRVAKNNPVDSLKYE